jgi:esterase/lipase superfamily enzyme
MWQRPWPKHQKEMPLSLSMVTTLRMRRGGPARLPSIWISWEHPSFYSWPSNGKVKDYIKDETNITWASPHFERFLELLAKYSTADRIHIIAHSMGNRAVCDALKHIKSNPDTRLKFTHLAAADIDADTFRELADTLRDLSARVTLYESSKDKALVASKKIHGNPRAGEPLLLVPGMDTIDASAIDTDFLAHSYFSNNWPLLSDIYNLLFNDHPPSNRFGLRPMQHADGKYYAFAS